MSTCTYCGQPAGFLRKFHEECREKHHRATISIPEFFLKSLESPMPAVRFHDLTTQLAKSNYISDSELKQLVISGLNALIETVLADRILTKIDHDRITEIGSSFGLNGLELGAAGIRLAKVAILRDLEQGRLPDYAKLMGVMPIKLGAGERLIWVFSNVIYYTERGRTGDVAAFQGISIRMMKGVYYRFGTVEGERIPTLQLSEQGTGDFVIGSRNVYFMSAATNAKLPARKIVSIRPFADGIQIMRDTANSKPEIFELDDPWFAVNAIARLNSL
jgi:hypothetical protein